MGEFCNYIYTIDSSNYSYVVIAPSFEDAKNIIIEDSDECVCDDHEVVGETHIESKILSKTLQGFYPDQTVECDPGYPERYLQNPDEIEYLKNIIEECHDIIGQHEDAICEALDALTSSQESSYEIDNAIYHLEKAPRDTLLPGTSRSFGSRYTYETLLNELKEVVQNLYHWGNSNTQWYLILKNRVNNEE